MIARFCKRRVALFTALMLIMPFTCHAVAQADTTAPINIRGTYYFSWSGIPFAKLWLDVEDNGNQYELTASFKSRGIVRIFKKLKSLSKSYGITDGQKSMHSLSFEYETDPDVSEQKHTRLRYDTLGELTLRDVFPEDDPWHRPPVSREKVTDVTTPGNLLWDFRRALLDAIKQDQTGFSLSFYDGQRLMSIHANRLGKEGYLIDETTYPVHKLALTRQLVDGFTDKEIKRYEEGEPVAYLYVGRDAPVIPLALEIDIKLGTLKAWFEPEAKE